MRSAHAHLMIVLQVVRTSFKRRICITIHVISRCETFFVDNLLINKTIILLDLAGYRLSLRHRRLNMWRYCTRFHRI